VTSRRSAPRSATSSCAWSRTWTAAAVRHDHARRL
jgi:hypothetical protein